MFLLIPTVFSTSVYCEKKVSRSLARLPGRGRYILFWSENVLSVVLLCARSQHHNFCSKVGHKIQPSHLTRTVSLLCCGDGETTICFWLIGAGVVFLSEQRSFTANTLSKLAGCLRPVFGAVNQHTCLILVG